MTFAAAAVGIPFAIYQFMAQRKQLAEQAKTIKGEFDRQRKRDELLDEQLKEIKDRGRVLERQQAQRVALMFTATTSTWAPGNIQTVEGGFHVAVVGNNSDRPIRDVICYISVQDDTSPLMADAVGRYVVSEVAVHHVRGLLQDVTNTGRIDLVRAGEQWAFVFNYPVARWRGARMSVTFADDAGIAWRIDHVLHLERADKPQTVEAAGAAAPAFGAAGPAAGGDPKSGGQERNEG